MDEFVHLVPIMNPFVRPVKIFFEAFRVYTYDMDGIYLMGSLLQRCEIPQQQVTLNQFHTRYTLEESIGEFSFTTH